MQAAKGAADAAIRLRFCSRRAAETADSGCKAAPYEPPPMRFAAAFRHTVAGGVVGGGHPKCGGCF